MPNGDVNYKLGKIAGHLQSIDGRLNANDIDHKEMKNALKDLNIWRWKTVGQIGVIVAVASGGATYLMKFIN